jgi:putative ABC transport system permease protein
MMNSLFSDLRHGVRSLRSSPGLVATSVLSLALGLGVNLTLFTAIGAVFFFEPTVADRDRVVSIEPGNSDQFSYLNYRDLLESGAFESATGYRGAALNMRANGVTERIEGLAVTPNFFEFIGVAPALGRHFAAAEAVPERQPRVAVLSHPFWQRRFGGNASVIGRDLTLNGETFAVIGVLPEIRPVTMLQDPDVYVPISPVVLASVDNRQNGNALTVLARMPPGMTREQALAALNTVNRRLEQAYPVVNQEMGQPARVRPLSGGDLAGSAQQVVIPAVLLMLFGLVLLSACANVAGLLLARAAGRQREMAVRFALGARRIQVVRLLLAESFGLAILGMVAGGILAFWLMRVLSVMTLPGGEVLNLSLEPSFGTGAYAMALLVATGVLCGLAPALRSTNRQLVSVIRESASLGVTRRLWLRHALVVGQVVACVVLLVMSSLLLRSLMRVTVMDPGFDINRGLVASVAVSAEGYLADGGLPLGERLVERLERVAGVESVSFANMLPLGNSTSASRLSAEGANTVGPRTYVNSIAPDYFATLGIPLVRGRDFNASDRLGGPPVAIVTEAFERAYFAGQGALGKRVRRSPHEPFFEIVGVAGDHMYGSYGDLSTPVFYMSYTQQPRVSTQVRPVVMAIRTNDSPAALVREVRQTIAAVDSSVSADVQTLRGATSFELGARGFVTRLLASAAALGLLLATIGLYGTMAFVVVTRTSEIGLRMALGATAGQILGKVLGQGLRLVGVGLGIGAAISLALAQVAAGLLAGLSPADPVAFAGTATLLLLVGAAACYLPARRASSIDPIVALRRL